ncbi:MULTISPECIES: hypothetical protein [unclassified Moritella]|uniref:hypothetical protein n=1 Tax=unclassified Moritella TaxID=2637987 RepID=UPI001BACB5D1|nr:MULTISPECIES: hypothetical protein [unclassified Moritella]QUM86076.1 hypothetical protein HWV02_16950 [Moritella sp. 28]QUM90315.1 hypothetical protein HWV03_16675 [Moritella sp. 36]
MIEIEYAIGEIKTSMFVVEDYVLSLVTKQWIKARDLNVGDSIAACDGATAEIVHINKTENLHSCPDLKIIHNHNYFVTKGRLSTHDKINDNAPSDPLEQIPYQLANKPSNFPDGTPTGEHAGPWAAAKYLSCDTSEDIIGWGRASDHMCAEDAAFHDLRNKLDDAIELDRSNVSISHAYVRKYTKKGRFVNTMSPCIHCRDNYGSALNDVTMGTSNVVKEGRGYLAPSRISDCLLTKPYSNFPHTSR